MDQKDQENLPPPPPLTRRELLTNLAYFRRSFENDAQSQANRQKSPPVQEGLSRRSVLMGLASLVIVALAGLLSKKMGEAKFSPPASPTPDVTPPLLPDKDISSEIPLEGDLTLKSEQPAERELLSPLEIYINQCPLFSNCSQEEKKIALSLVGNQIEHYQKGYENDPRGLKKRLEDAWSWKQTGMIDEVADDLGFKKDAFARELLPALIFVESEGNPRAGQEKLAQNKDAAVGLCQLQPSTAQELAKKLVNPKLKNPPDLFDPWTSIALALEFLRQKFQTYPDWSLTTWVYHLGERNMNQAIYQYESSEIKRPILELDTAFKNSSFPATKRYVEEDKLNFIKLVTSPAVTADLKSLGAFGDDTQHYVTRIAAASFMLLQVLG